jgi:thioesterase domain-containing protein
MVQPRGPYHLAGHSLGGMVAWEVAQQLRDEGEDVALLAVIDTIFPWREDQLPPGHTGTAPPVRHLSPMNQMRRLRRAAPDAAHISVAGLHPRERKNQIDLFFRHGQILARRYRPRPWNGPTIVYKAQTLAPGDRRFDWEPLLRGPWEEHWLPGNHNTVLAEPNAAQLAGHLGARLADPSLVGSLTSHREPDRSGLAG